MDENYNPLNKDDKENEKQIKQTQENNDFLTVQQKKDDNGVYSAASFISNKEPINPTAMEPKHEKPREFPNSVLNSNYAESTAAIKSSCVDNSSPFAQPIMSQNANTNRSSKTHNKKQVIVIAVLCAVISIILGMIGGYVSSTYLGGSIVYKVPSGSDNNISEDVGSGKTVAQVADEVSNSVVEISTESVRTGSYFNQYVTEGAGSGVIISADGYIVTNNHVVSGASKVTVRTKSGDSFTASVKGTDSTSDVALLKVEASGLTPVVIGDSSTLKVGDTSVVIGNPLGQLGGTVTTGIISALDREIEISGSKMNLLQTDAAINPGNSGGGMFNSNGELVGIVVAKSSGESIEGLGFAIPVNDITNVIQDISQFGYVKGRPQLGVSLIDVNNAQTAWQYGVSKYGVYVYSVNEGSGAQQAGLKSGDLIQAVNDEAVSTSSDVKAIIQQHNVGETIVLTIVRDNKQQQISVTLGESLPVATSGVEN